MRPCLRYAPVSLLCLFGLAACDPAAFPQSGAVGFSPVPEEVRAMAAPYQNVDTARILPEDNCYWYLHAGPVETTLLPLRTPEGRRICTSAGVEAFESGAALAS